METAEKLYYSIGEVKDITGVESHVLRYWESEFPMFKPRKSRSGQRAYTRRDIEMALTIKNLLYSEKFTIKGAKIKLKEPERIVEPVAAPPVSEPVQASRALGLEKSIHTRKAKVADESDQLTFTPIETAADAQMTEREFLLHLRGELVQTSKTIKEIVTGLGG